MIKQGLQQKLLQKLSPQQIQFIKLLQLPTAELQARIEQELVDNPALEDQAELTDDYGEYEDPYAEENDADTVSDEEKYDEAADLMDTFGEDDYDYRTRQKSDPNQEHYEAPVVSYDTLLEDLEEQLSLQNFNEQQALIARHIIGNIDEDGYLRRDLFALVDDLVFKHNLKVEAEEVEEVLSVVQQLDPPGIAARDMQECLLLQLDRKPDTPAVETARRMMMDHFDTFTKKHFQKIISRMDLSEEEFRQALEVIQKLNPRPGGAVGGGQRAQYIKPDFVLRVKGEDVLVRLNKADAPELRISRRYKKMLEEMPREGKNAKDTLSFLKKKVDDAKWFIDAIRQREDTLLRTMNTIAEKQKDFFVSNGDTTKLHPMILKDVAEEINMDISTVSRVANSKYVETPFGIYPLKYFFSEGITTQTGEEVSNREVKHILETEIAKENKRKPLSDRALAEILEERGYNIARRTVAKYREQLKIPVARMRKEL